MPPVREITSSSEFKKIIGESKLTVVDFYATWCGPCKMVAPRFDALSGKYPLVQFLRCDVDKVQEIAGEYSVRAMPTFLFFKKGKQVDEVVGADIGSVERKINQLQGSGSGGSDMPSTGYVLGTGKQVNAAGVGANLQMPGKQWFIDNWVVVGAGILGLYYMYSSFTN